MKAPLCWKLPGDSACKSGGSEASFATTFSDRRGESLGGELLLVVELSVLVHGDELLAVAA